MKVSVDSVIDDAKFRLGLRDTTYADLDLERLVDEGARQMGNLSGFVIKCEELTIDCAKAELPSDCNQVICFSFCGEGCSGCCNYTFDPAVEPNPYPPTTCTCCNWQYYVRNRNVLTEFCGMGVNACSWEGGFDTQGGFLVFPSSISFTEVKVWYQGWNEDSDGLMILDELDQRGLGAYAAYRYASAGQNYKFYPQRKEWQQEWIAQKNKRIAQDFKKDHQENIRLFAEVARGICMNPWTIYNQNF